MGAERDLTRLATLDLSATQVLDHYMVVESHHTTESWAEIRAVTPRGVERNIEHAEAKLNGHAAKMNGHHEVGEGGENDNSDGFGGDDGAA